MKRTSRTLVGFGVLFLVFTLVIAAPTSATNSYVEGTDEGAALYDPLKVNEIALNISDANKESLYWSPETYVPAKFSITIDGVTTGPLDVGVRVKGGWGSLRNIYQKCSFRIKFNFVVPKQKFMGLKKIVLNNMVQDASMIHEQLAYRFMRAVGIPAARTGYANVTVNNQLYGLYLNLEAVDKTMLKRWYNGTNHMFEGAYWTDAIPEHFWNYELDEGDPITWENYLTSDLWNFVNLQTLSGDEWFDAISQVADMRELTRLFAAELFISHWDGYTYTIWNNYYLHFDLDGKATILPSGMDQTWGGGYYPFVEPWGHGVLYQKCLEVTRCYEMYMGAIGRVKTVYESLNLSTMASEILPVIQSSVSADTMKEYGSDWTFYLQDTIDDVLVNRTAGISDLISSYKPNRPTGFIARDKLTGTITWNDDNLNNVPLVGHQIRTTTNNVNWTDSEIFDGDSAQIQLTPGVTTQVRVRTINEVGSSTWSTPVSIATPHLPPAPVVNTSRAGTDFLVVWEDDSSPSIDIDSYDVGISEDNSNWSFSNQTELFTNFSLDIGQQIYVRVRSINSAGESSWSEPVRLSVAALPKVKLLKFQKSGAKVKVSWKAASNKNYTITGYRVASSLTGQSWKKATFTNTTSLLFAHPNGKTRYYRIQVITEAGNSAWSTPIKYARK